MYFKINTERIARYSSLAKNKLAIDWYCNQCRYSLEIIPWISLIFYMLISVLILSIILEVVKSYKR